MSPYLGKLVNLTSPNLGGECRRTCSGDGVAEFRMPLTVSACCVHGQGMALARRERRHRAFTWANWCT